MPRNWLSIRVELVSGRGEVFWPRAGRDFAAQRTHRFAHLANAIDSAFARWDRSHLHQFVLADGRRIGMAEYDEDDELDLIDGATMTLATLQLGEQFYYEFDFGDSWTHLCTVGPEFIDPLDALGIRPRRGSSSAGVSFRTSTDDAWRTDDGRGPGSAATPMAPICRGAFPGDGLTAQNSGTVDNPQCMAMISKSRSRCATATSSRNAIAAIRQSIMLRTVSPCRRHCR